MGIMPPAGPDELLAARGDASRGLRAAPRHARYRQRQRHPNLSSPPRDPLLGVGHPEYLFLNFTGHFGGSRYPVVPPRGEPVARAACGSPAHLESACAGLPSKTTQEATSRRALGPVESSGGDKGPDKIVSRNPKY